MAFDTIKLDKGLYTSNKGFTKSLEEIDPSENYKGTEYEGLDAYQRQLKRFDIKVSGKNCDTIAKFFETSDSATLFPEFVARAVKMGLDENNVIDELVATTTYIDSVDYRSITALDYEMGSYYAEQINEGAFIPETVIRTNETLTHLVKHGRSIVASYEAIKSQKIDLFAIALKQIGRYINRCELETLALTLAENDHIVEPEQSGEIAYSDILEMWSSLLPYNMNVILTTPGNAVKLLQLPEFKDALAGNKFHGTGEMVTPLGAKLFTADSETLLNSVIGLDKNYAFEKVQFGDIVTDFDKLIDRQLERATITLTSGFNRIIEKACVTCF